MKKNRCRACASNLPEGERYHPECVPPPKRDSLTKAKKLLQALADGADVRALSAEYGPHALAHARRKLRAEGVGNGA